MKKVAKFLLIIVLLIAAINVFSNISRADGEVIDVLGKAVKGGYSLSLLSDKGLLRTYIRTNKGYIDDNDVIDAINDEFLTQL